MEVYLNVVVLLMKPYAYIPFRKLRTAFFPSLFMARVLNDAQQKTVLNNTPYSKVAANKLFFCLHVN